MLAIADLAEIHEGCRCNRWQAWFPMSQLADLVVVTDPPVESPVAHRAVHHVRRLRYLHWLQHYRQWLRGASDATRDHSKRLHLQA